MGNFFHSPRKVTGQNSDAFKVPCKCDRSEYEYQPVTAEGELTLEGVYEQFCWICRMTVTGPRARA